MKKYKLIKDLPGLRVGVVFRESEDHSGYCNCVDPLGTRPNVKPHFYFDKEIVENNPKWFEEAK